MFYQLLLGPMGCPLNTSTVFLKNLHLSFSPNPFIAFACCTLISGNVLGATLSCPIQRDNLLCGLFPPPPAARAALLPSPAPANPSGLLSSFPPDLRELQGKGVWEPCSEQVADEAGGWIPLPPTLPQVLSLPC